MSPKRVWRHSERGAREYEGMGSPSSFGAGLNVTAGSWTRGTGGKRRVKRKRVDMERDGTMSYQPARMSAACSNELMQLQVD